jgi:transcriptional regulator with XRE-family HTH domain
MLKDNLTQARKSAGFTQEDVALQLNIKRQTYSAYERGLSTPNAHTLKQLADFFGVPAGLLLMEEEPVLSVEADNSRKHLLFGLFRKLRECSNKELKEFTYYIEHRNIDSQTKLAK